MGLTSGMSAKRGFTSVLLHELEAIEANWQVAIDGLDPEGLHQLRVAMRRTRAVIGQSKGVLPTVTRRLYSDEFAWLAGSTGPTRDLDVYVIEWPSYVDGMSTKSTEALQPVLDRIELDRAQARTALVAVLQSARANDVIEAWRATLADGQALATGECGSAMPVDDIGPSLGQVLAKRFRHAHSRVLDAGRRIDPDSPAEALHELRKDAKKLRYIVDCFSPVLPKKLRNAFGEQLQGLQDNLGEHQDAQVHISELDTVAHGLPASRRNTDTFMALGRLLERLEQTQRNARSELAERFRSYDSHKTMRIVRELLGTLDDAHR